MPNRSDLVLTTVGGVAVGELILRTLPEFLGLGDNIILPVVVLLSAKHLLDVAVLGWGVGWLLLFAVVFHYGPHLFPAKIVDWAAGIPVRLAVATSSVFVGMLVEQAIIQTAFPDATQIITITPEVVSYTLGWTVLGFAVAAVLPAYGATNELLSKPSGTFVLLSDEIRDNISFWGFTLRGAFVAVAVGVLLAEVSLMYPIPELLIVGVVMYDGTLEYLLGLTPVSSRRDLVERFSTGTVAAWGTAVNVTILGYVVGILFGVVLLSLYAFSRIDLATIFDAGPARVVFGGLCLLPAVVYVIRYCDQILHRIPARMHIIMHGWDSVDEVPPRVSGALIPPAALLLAFDCGLAGTLGWVDWGVVLLLAAATLLVSYYPFPLPLDVGDFRAVPLSTALSASLLTTGIQLQSVSESTLPSGIQPEEVLMLLLPALLVALLVLTPFALANGYVEWRAGNDYGARGGRLLGISWAAFTLFSLAVVAMVAAGINPDPEVHPQGTTLLLIQAVSTGWLFSGIAAAFTGVKYLLTVTTDAIRAAWKLLKLVAYTPVWLLKITGTWIGNRSVVAELREID